MKDQCHPSVLLQIPKIIKISTKIYKTNKVMLVPKHRRISSCRTSEWLMKYDLNYEHQNYSDENEEKIDIHPSDQQHQLKKMFIYRPSHTPTHYLKIE